MLSFRADKYVGESFLASRRKDALVTSEEHNEWHERIERAAGEVCWMFSCQRLLRPSEEVVAQETQRQGKEEEGAPPSRVRPMEPARGDSSKPPSWDFLMHPPLYGDYLCRTRKPSFHAPVKRTARAHSPSFWDAEPETKRRNAPAKHTREEETAQEETFHGE